MTGFIVRERIRTQRQRLGVGASVLAKLEAELTELRRQRRLRQNGWVWYLAPGVGMIAIHMMVITQQSTAWSLIRQSLGTWDSGCFRG